MRNSGVAAFVIVSLAACGGGGGKTNDMSAPGGDDLAVVADLSGTDGAAKPDAATGDGGSSSVTPLSACSTVEVDTLGGIQVAEGQKTISYGGKYFATWLQAASITPDGLQHWKARYFDGTAFQTEIDLGANYGGDPLNGAVDKHGTGFLQGLGVGSGVGIRWVADMNAGTIATPTTFTIFDHTLSFALAGLSTGAISVYGTGTNPGTDTADLYGSGVWTNTGYNAGVATGVEIHAAVNASNQGAATWYIANAGSTYTLYVATFNGTSFAAPVSRLFPATGGASINYRFAPLSNGDLAFAWNGVGGLGVVFTTFHVGTSTWDPDQTLDTTATASEVPPIILADGSDRLTVGWVRKSTVNPNFTDLVVLRRLDGTTWSTPKELGVAEYTLMKLDPSGNPVAALYQVNVTGLTVTRAAADSNTWDTPVSTGVDGESVILPYADIAFTAAGDPVVIATNVPATTPQVSASTCH
jgi:hypothetical protein